MIFNLNVYIAFQNRLPNTEDEFSKSNVGVHLKPEVLQKGLAMI